MNFKQIIEEINKLTEDEPIGEEVLQDIPAEEPEVTPEFNDGMSLADTFDTKAKIARSLEGLKAAVDDFKTATSEKVDLLKDAMLLQNIEQLDVVLVDIEKQLASGSNLLGDSELNDAFKAELPNEEVEEETETRKEPAENEENDAEEETEEEDFEAFDFDAEAGLDLLPND